MKYTLTAQEIADLCGLTPSSVNYLFRHGNIDVPHIRFGDQLRVMTFPFLDYLKENGRNEQRLRIRQYCEGQGA
jgi:hypothetical protein